MRFAQLIGVAILCHAMPVALSAQAGGHKGSGSPDTLPEHVVARGDDFLQQAERTRARRSVRCRRTHFLLHE